MILRFEFQEQIKSVEAKIWTIKEIAKPLKKPNLCTSSLTIAGAIFKREKMGAQSILQKTFSCEGVNAKCIKQLF